MEPAQLFNWLAQQPRGSGTSLECGAGMGEVTQFLSRRYSRALAMDRQIHAPQTNCQWIIGDAEHLPFKDNSLDLVVSVQALHHFDCNRHVREANRVLKPGGCFAALSWGDVVIPEALSQAYANVSNAVAPFWEENRKWVLSGYAGLHFPGDRIELPETSRTQYMTGDEFMLYVSTWSALQSAMNAGVDIGEPDFSELESQPEKYRVSWPLLGQVFRV